MIHKSRFIVMLGLVMALGIAAVAYADGDGDNDAFVDGKVKPNELDQRKFKPVQFFTGVRTEGPVTGAQQNPEKEVISFGKNIKFDLGAAPNCSAPIEGQTTAGAKAACPDESNIGSGEAAVAFPDGDDADTEPDVVNDIVVTVFKGPGKKEVRLHTYSNSLPGATPTVNGKIVDSKAGKKYGQALVVADAPDAAGDVAMITKFNATIEKSSKVVKARCKAKKFLFERVVTYDDGTKDTATREQKCKRK